MLRLYIPTTYSELYHADRIVMSSNQITYNECYFCNEGMIKLMSQSITFNNNQINYVNNNAYSINKNPTAPLLRFMIRRPYQSISAVPSVLVTETITYDSGYIYNYYSVNPGRAINFEYEPMPLANEQVPTTDQIQIITAQFYYMQTKGSGALMKVQVKDIRMKISSVTFDSISTQATADTQYGAVIYAQELGQLTLSSITASQFWVNSNPTYPNGQGGFLYADMSQYFKLIVQSSSFKCSTSSYVLTTVQTTLNSNSWSKGSAFYMNDQGSGVDAYFTDSIMTDCSTALKGGLIQIQSATNTAKLSIIQSTLNLNSAAEGGAIYCNGCELTLQQLNLQQNVASRGGDFYILNPVGATTSVVADSIYAQSSLALKEGGSFYIQETRLAQPTVVKFIRPTPFTSYLSKYTSVSAGTQGGLAFIKPTSSLSILMTDTIISTASSFLEGGLIYADSTLTGNCDLQMAIDTISSVSASKGSILFCPITSTTSTISIQSTTFTSLSTTLDGGMFYTQGQSDKTFTLSSLTITNVYSGGKGGLIFSQSQGIHTLSITDSVVKQINSVDQGGIFFPHQASSVVLTVKNSQFIGFKSQSLGSFVSISTLQLSKSLAITLTGSTFTCIDNSIWATWPSVYNSAVTKLNTLTPNIGGAFFVSSAQSGSTITSSDNKFHQCYTTTSGSIFYLSTGVKLNDLRSNFKQNAGMQGEIYCADCQASFKDSEFSDSLSYDGSIITMVNAAQATFDGVKMNHGKSLHDGGAIHISGTGAVSLAFINCPSAGTMTYFEAGNNGGFLFTTNPALDFTTANCKWNHLFAANTGGFMYGDIANMDISGCDLTNITAGIAGSFIQTTSSSFKFKLSQCQVTCIQVPNQAIIDSSLTTIPLTPKIGSFFDISNAATVLSSDNTYKNCYTASKGAIFKLLNTQFTDLNSLYSGNAAIDGGCIYQKDTSSTFTNVQFKGNFGYRGGSLQAQGASILTFTNVQLDQSKAFTDGGFLYASETGASQIKIIVNGVSSLKNARALQNGGLFYINNPSAIFEMKVATPVSASQADLNGGFAYILKALEVDVYSSTFNLVKSLQSGSIIYSISTLTTFTLQDNIISCKSTGYTDLAPGLQVVTPVSQLGGAFYIQSAALVSSIGNEIKYCHLADVGGAFYLESTVFIDTSLTSKFTKNAALKGGAFYCKSCKMTLSNSIISGNQAVYGGVFYIENDSTITLTSIKVDSSQTIKNGGVIYAIETNAAAPSATLSIQNPTNIQTFKTIVSKEDGGAIYLDHPKLDVTLQQVIANDVKVSDDNFKGGIIFIKRGRILTLTNNVFKSYQSPGSGSTIYSDWLNLNLQMSYNEFNCKNTHWDVMLSSDLSQPKKYIGGSIYIKDAVSTVQSNSNLFTNCYSSDQGGGISLINSKINDISSRYIYNGAINGGAIYCENCDLLLLGITFDYNSAYNGGTIYFKDHINPHYTSGNTITNSQAYNNGGTFYFTGVTSNLVTLNSYIIQQTAAVQNGGMAFVDNQNQQVKFIGMSLTSSHTAKGVGGGFYILQAAQVEITNSQAKLFSSPIQGSFMHSESYSVKISISSLDAKCLSSPYIFATDLDGKINVVSPKYSIGGAFYIMNAISVTQVNSKIYNCYICDQGGAYSLYSTYFSDTGSTYQDNAALQGGQIFTQSSQISLNSISFQNSYAQQGGIIYGLNDNPIIIVSSSFINSRAVKNGGIAYFLSINSPATIGLPTFTVKYKFCTFNSQSADTLNGGGFYIENFQLAELILEQTQFVDSKAKLNGGIFYVKDMNGPLSIYENGASNFNSFQIMNASLLGSMIYSESPSFSLNIRKSIVECKTSYINAEVSESLSNEKSYAGGAIYIKDSILGLTSTLNTFRNCYATHAGAIIFLENSKLDDSNSLFYQNQALQGGTIKCIKCNIGLQNSQFYDNQAIDGGAMYLDNQVAITAKNTPIYNNRAVNRGGAIAFTKSSLGVFAPTMASFKSIFNIHDNRASDGGMIFVDNQYISIEFIDNEIWDIYASKRGGFISALEVDGIRFEKTKIWDTFAPDSIFLYSVSQFLDLEILETNLICNTTLNLLDQQEMLKNSSQLQFDSTTTMFISNAHNINIYGSNFLGCGTSQKGGLFQLYNTRLTDDSSVYTNMAAIKGGVIMCELCSMKLHRSKFLNNMASIGGVIIMKSFSYLDAKQIQFIENTAYELAGVLQVTTESYFDIESSTFEKNYASETSAIDILGSSKLFNNTLRSSYLEENLAKKKTMSIMISNIIIQRVQFVNNQANEKTKVIFAGFSKILIEDCNFKNSLKFKEYPERYLDETIYGTFMFVILDVELRIINTKFFDGFAIQGGAIYLSGDSSMNISNSEFHGNYALQQGGAIFAQGFYFIKIDQGSIISNNYARDKGDDFYIVNTEEPFIIDDIIVENLNAKTSMYFERVQLSMNKVTFQNIYGNPFSIKGAALACFDCKSILIKKSIFTNLKSALGGAIFIQENENKKNLVALPTKYLIQNSKFINCTAITGGAIYIGNPQAMTISNCIFRNNSAILPNSKQGYYLTSGQGGAIYYLCDNVIQNCKLRITNGTQFESNFAKSQGGAVNNDIIEAEYTDDVTFANNRAEIYGDNIAAFAQLLGIISRDKYQQIINKYKNKDDGKDPYLSGLKSYYGLSRMLASVQDANNFTTFGEIKEKRGQYLISNQLNQQRSGGTIPIFYMAHIDPYGEIVTSDSTSKVRVTINTTYNHNPLSKLYSPAIDGESQFQAQVGVIEIKDLQFVGSPGYDYSILFSTNGVDLDKKSNQLYLASKEKLDLDLRLNINLRECLLGEQFSPIGKCQQCPAGSGFTLVKMTSPGDCSPCPTSKAVCYGGTNIGPKPGYWRKSNVTSIFIPCMNYQACLGMIPPDYNPMGSCAKGYQGILCSECMPGYSKTGEYKCAQCPDPKSNIVRLVFIFIVVAGLIIFMIRSTLLGAHEKNNVTNIFFKILMNHFQLLILSASFNFKWPKIVTDFFDSAKPVAQVSEQVLSFDCFLDQRKNTTNSTTSAIVYIDNGQITFRIFFEKLIMMALLPLIIAGFSFLFWTIYKHCKKDKPDIMGKLMSTLVIGLFLVHPNIVQMMFFNFKCKDVDDDKRVQDDLQIVCWSKSHKFFSFTVAMPAIIVWGLGIPFFALILLSRVRNQLDSVEAREKFGFLYRGYRKSFYYWEIIIMYRKIGLIFISVFISAFGVITQALIVFMVLVCFLVINTKKKPFSTQVLNDLETMSLGTSMITIYCGFYFLSDIPESFIKDNPDVKAGLVLGEPIKLVFFSSIVIANIFFFFYWGLKMFQEIRDKFRKSLPRFYTCLCLCGDPQRYERETEQYRIALENENLKEDFFKSLNQVKALYKEGKLVLTHQNIQRLQQYLDQTKVLGVAGMNIKVQENKGIIIESRKDKSKEGVLENDYYKYEEDLRRYAKGRIDIKHSQLAKNNPHGPKVEDQLQIQGMEDYDLHQMTLNIDNSLYGLNQSVVIGEDNEQINRDNKRLVKKKQNKLKNNIDYENYKAPSDNLNPTTPMSQMSLTLKPMDIEEKSSREGDQSSDFSNEKQGYKSKMLFVKTQTKNHHDQVEERQENQNENNRVSDFDDSNLFTDQGLVNAQAGTNPSADQVQARQDLIRELEEQNEIDDFIFQESEFSGISIDNTRQQQTAVNQQLQMQQRGHFSLLD